MLFRLTEAGRRWLWGKLMPCGNFGSAFVHFVSTDKAMKLKREAREDGLHVAEADIAMLFRKTI